jgi:hypothetical protein
VSVVDDGDIGVVGPVEVGTTLFSVRSETSSDLSTRGIEVGDGGEVVDGGEVDESIEAVAILLSVRSEMSSCCNARRFFDLYGLVQNTIT